MFRFVQCNAVLDAEFALRKYTCITEGDTIVISYHEQEYALLVKKVEVAGNAKPAAGRPVAGCLIDTSVVVDFESPQESAPEEEKVADLVLGAPLGDTVKSGCYKYFRIKLVDPHVGIQCMVTCKEGDADVYMSAEITAPKIENSHHEWTSALSAEKTVFITSGDKKFSKTWYFIGVYGYKSDAVFELLVKELTPQEDLEKQALLIAGAAGGPAVAEEENTDPSKKKCENCWKYVPIKQMSMHSMQW